MPGTIPATSQLDRLISMTAINVLAGSRAMRDRLKLFNVCMGSSIGSQRTMDAISTPPPHSIFHRGIRRRGGTIFWATLPSSGHTNSPHPSSREGHDSTAGWSPPERGAVNPHAVHDLGQPTRQRYDRLFHPAMPRDLHRQGLEPGPFRRTHQLAVGRFVEHHPHHLISTP